MVKLIWEPSGVVRKFSGRVIDVDLERSAIAIQADPGFDRLRYVIHDFLDCTELAVSPNTIEEVLARASVATSRHPEFRSAFVGNLPELRNMVGDFERMAMFPHPFRLFGTLEEARAFVAGVCR